MDGIDFKGKRILVVGAHPDDNDFGAGATVAKAAQQGAEVFYLIATTGQRGSSDETMTAERLSDTRKKEQEAAAGALGVREVHFLSYVDGELVPDIRLVCNLGPDGGYKDRGGARLWDTRRAASKKGLPPRPGRPDRLRVRRFPMRTPWNM